MVYDVSYEKIKLVTKTKNNNIRIIWNEPNKHNDFKLDFGIADKIDFDGLISTINTAIINFKKETGYQFIKYDKKFSKMSTDQHYNLSRSENPEYIDYINLHTRHTFGERVSAEYEAKMWDLIVACKLLNLDTKFLIDYSEEERDNIEHVKKYVKVFDMANKEIYELNKEIIKLEDSCENAEAFKKIKDTKQYVELEEKEKKFRKDYAKYARETRDWDEFYLNHAFAWRFYDKRVKIIYDKWKENVPLTEFENDTEDGWVNYMLEQLKTEHGKNPLTQSAFSQTKLLNSIKLRDRNKSTLASFVKPEGIPDEAIFNNCWYDGKNKMWYLADDNIYPRLRQFATSDPDESMTKCGRRAWGFPEKVVRWSSGFPIIPIKYYEEEGTQKLYVSRKDGYPITSHLRTWRVMILPILTEKDQTFQIATQWYKITYKTTDLACTIRNRGDIIDIPTTILPMFHEMWGMKHVPLNERIRRALFHIETGLTLPVELVSYDPNFKYENHQKFMKRPELYKYYTNEDLFEFRKWIKEHKERELNTKD